MFAIYSVNLQPQSCCNMNILQREVTLNALHTCQKSNCASGFHYISEMMWLLLILRDVLFIKRHVTVGFCHFLMKPSIEYSIYHISKPNSIVKPGLRMCMFTSPVAVFKSVENCMVVFLREPLILWKAVMKPLCEIYKTIETGDSAMRNVSFDFICEIFIFLYIPKWLRWL